MRVPAPSGRGGTASAHSSGVDADRNRRVERGDATEQPRGARVLIVEDDAVSARVLGKLLRSDGYDVETAFDGAAAIARLSRGPALDALIVDYQLPHADGSAVASYAKSIDPTIRVIVVTGYPERAATGMRGAKVLGKPLAYGELTRELERYFAR